jgi:hypothetical protein
MHSALRLNPMFRSFSAAHYSVRHFRANSESHFVVKKKTFLQGYR